MNRCVAYFAMASLFTLLIGCGAPKISADKWSETSVKTEVDLTEAFGDGTPVNGHLRKTVITDYDLPENARMLKWADPNEDGVYYLAAIVDGKVEQRIKWNSNDK